ncbi:hypothetical protein Pmar_PMAR020949, partial [Perkinsus marinus ATCC 50983]
MYFSATSFAKLNVPFYLKLYLATTIIAFVKGERNLVKAARRLIVNACLSSFVMTG